MQLNAFGPVIAHSLFTSITHLTNACRALADNCITGITANIEHLRDVVQHSIGIVTALNPRIGCTAATDAAVDALAGGRSILDLAAETHAGDRRPAQLVAARGTAAGVHPVERTGERDLIPMAKELGLGTVLWSPLAGGVLTGTYSREDLTASTRGDRRLGSGLARLSPARSGRVREDGVGPGRGRAR